MGIKIYPSADCIFLVFRESCPLFQCFAARPSDCKSFCANLAAADSFERSQERGTKVSCFGITRDLSNSQRNHNTPQHTSLSISASSSQSKHAFLAMLSQCLPNFLQMLPIPQRLHLHHQIRYRLRQTGQLPRLLRHHRLHIPHFSLQITRACGRAGGCGCGCFCAFWFRGHRDRFAWVR